MADTPPNYSIFSDEISDYVFDLQESLAYVRASLGLSNDFPVYTREMGQEVLDTIDREIRSSPDDLSPEERQEYLFERFSENIPYEKRVQLYQNPRARAAFMSLFEHADLLVAQVNALHFG
ncbi:MAG: hypothetical protein KA099_06795 [Alphaproteobacteria bacterium]|nr:hypothetical protein [Alphaproteobacteria bacterium]MBP7758082.1 hypothetical protein [Alphaproteobacteria bacterium]MBP7761485.1 hypothetical protein [Alphaproteobacteria bacterium]MBP7905016.1 hypothetical protein [Alphaproteobacteria bacterium]